MSHLRHELRAYACLLALAGLGILTMMDHAHILPVAHCWTVVGGQAVDLCTPQKHPIPLDFGPAPCPDDRLWTLAEFGHCYR